MTEFWIALGILVLVWILFFLTWALFDKIDRRR